MIGQLQIYRNEQPHLAVNIDKETFFSHVVMGEHIISSSFLSSDPLDIDEGDYVMLGGEKFSVNKTLPPLTRSASNELKYTLQLQGYIYDLHYAAYRHLGSAEFELFATADVFIRIMVECLNNIYSGWSVGIIDITEPKLIQFFESGKGFSCKGAIIKIAEAFGLEFWLTGKTLNLTAQAGVDTNITFEYGRGRGLYEIVRGEIDNELYFNRLYVEGSTRNIPVGYRGGMKRLQIDVPYLQLDIPAGKRIRETSVVIDDIFPKRVGTITAVSADMLTITDSSIDFDLNGNKIEGEKATVEMLTGENSGQSFEIDKYNHATKTIILVPNTATTGEIRPNATFEIKPGDQYFFAGIKVPETYILAAEAELKVRGIELLNKAARYVPPYSVRVSDKFMRDNGLKINAGDRVRLKDAALGIDVKIRVSAVKFSLVDPYTVELLISDVIPYTPEERSIIEIDKVKKETVVVRKRSTEMSRVNWKATAELATLLDTLKAEMLLIMVEGGQYNTGIVAQVSRDAFSTTEGTIIQSEYLDNGGIWSVPSFYTLLPGPSAYYVYFKADRNTMTAEVVLSTTKIALDEDFGFYYFPFGIISSIINNTRVFNSTKGYTRITGSNITTGRLTSNDGLTWLDLDTGEIRGKFTFTSGADVEETIGNVADEKVNELADGLGGLAYKDAVEKAQLGSTIIEGGYIRSDLIKVLTLIANNLIAGPVKITAANGNIVFEDAQKNAIMMIDDTGSFDGIRVSSTPPLERPDGSPDPDYLYSKVVQINGADVLRYFYAIRGAGMRIGLSPLNSDGFSSWGRLGYYTNGKYEASYEGQGIIFDKDGFTANGSRSKSGHVILENKVNNYRVLEFKNGLLVGEITSLPIADYKPITADQIIPLPTNDTDDTGYDPQSSIPGDGGTVDPPTEDPDEPGEEPAEPPIAPPVALTTNDYPYRVGYVKKEMGVTNSTYLSMFPTYGKNLIGSENKLKFGAIRTSTGGWRWAEADNFMAFAKTHNIPVHFHGPAWYNDWSDFMQALVGTPDGYEVGKALVYEHYATVFARYPDQFISIDGVNEQIKDDGTEIQTGPRALFGDDLWEIYYGAIQAARPNIVKLITDFNYETGNMNRTNTTVAIIDRLASKGITIEGIGFQMHTALGSNIDVMRERFRFWDNKNMKVMMTELDVKTNIGGRGTVYTQGMAVELADFYVDLLDAYEKGLRPVNRFGVLMFAVSDKEGESHLNYPTKTHHPMLFDENYQRKLAFNKVVERLLRQPEVFEIYQDFELGDISSGNFIGSPTGGTSPQVWQMISSDPNAKAHVTSTGLSMAQTQINVFNHVVVDGSSANFTASTRAGVVFGYDVRVMHFAFRLVDGENLFSIQAYKSGSTDVWRLVKRKAGSDILLHTSSIKPSWGQVISVTCDLDTISYSINGIQVGSVADSDFQTATKLGFKFKGHFDADKESSFKYIKYNPKLEL